MTPIWMALLAVRGFELHVHKDTRKMFTIMANFTKMGGMFSQATMWRWDVHGREYFAGANDAVATDVEAWGKELKL